LESARDSGQSENELLQIWFQGELSATFALLEVINRRNGKSNVTIVIVSSHSIAFHLGG
jgi:hypothetical protein